MFSTIFTTTTLFQHTVTTLSLHKQIITSTTTSLQLPKITFTSQNSYFLLLHIKFYEKQFLARNDPFEADLHGLEPEKLVLLMRSLNEQAMGLNEEGKTKWWPKRVLVPWKILSRNREPRSSQSL